MMSLFSAPWLSQRVVEALDTGTPQPAGHSCGKAKKDARIISHCLLCVRKLHEAKSTHAAPAAFDRNSPPPAALYLTNSSADAGSCRPATSMAVRHASCAPERGSPESSANRSATALRSLCLASTLPIDVRGVRQALCTVLNDW